MNCVFHPINAAIARCSACERPLCHACDHRIKGIPCCQDCIVAGIETLRRNAGAGPHIVHQIGRNEEKSPLIALLLGLFPGVGAAYNGQNIKALAHFLAVVGLWVLADIFGMPLGIALGLGGVGFYFYSIYDAFQSAQRLRRGEDVRVEDERLKLFLQQRMNLFGALLIGVGALAMLNFWIPNLLHRVWPVLLIIAGAYLVWSYYSGGHAPQVKTVYHPAPRILHPQPQGLGGDERRVP
ncbi:MAG: B-box zinc finger protein [Blastocatellia bacterium]